jgi:hypothetical protein
VLHDQVTVRGGRDWLVFDGRDHVTYRQAYDDGLRVACALGVDKRVALLRNQCEFVPFFVGTLAAGGRPNHILITGTRHLDVVLPEYLQHHNAHRPHRSPHQRPSVDETPRPSGATIQVLRRDRIGGLLREYVQLA